MSPISLASEYQLEQPALLMKTLDAIPPAEEPRNILNWFDLGGIITWHHGEHWKVSIDPRAELGYDLAVMPSVSNAFSYPESWLSLSERHHIDAVVTPKESPLCRGHLLTQEWQPIGGDGNWAVFVRAQLGGNLPTYRLNPCQTEKEFLQACTAQPQLVENAIQMAKRDQSAFSARLASIGAWACAQDADSALYWADESIRREPRNLVSYRTRMLLHKALGLSTLADSQRLWWFSP